MESPGPDVSVNSARIFAEVGNPSQVESVLENLRPKLAAFPGLSYSIIREQSALAQLLSFSGAEVGLKVKGEDLGRLDEIAEDLAGRLKGHPGDRGRPHDGRRGQAGVPGQDKNRRPRKVRRRVAGRRRQLHCRACVEAASRRPSSGSSKKSMTSWCARKPGRGGISIPFFDEEFPNRGSLIPLRELVTYELVRGPREIRRADQRREVVVSANLHEHENQSGQFPRSTGKSPRSTSPRGYQVTLAGEQEEMSRSFRSLAIALLLAILLTYMIMAAQFESLLHPFLVMFTLPMGAAGAFLALLVAGQSLNVISIIGLVVLVGLVVDDAIVEVDTMNQLRRQRRRSPTGGRGSLPRAAPADPDGVPQHGLRRHPAGLGNGRRR